MWTNTLKVSNSVLFRKAISTSNTKFPGANFKYDVIASKRSISTKLSISSTRSMRPTLFGTIRTQNLNQTKIISNKQGSVFINRGFSTPEPPPVPTPSMVPRKEQIDPKQLDAMLENLEVDTGIAEFVDKVPVGFLDKIFAVHPLDPPHMLCEYLHTSLGLPWWLSLVLLSIGTRFMLFPIVIRNLKNIHKTNESKEAMDKLSMEMKVAAQQGDQQEAARLQGKLWEMIAKGPGWKAMKINIMITAPVYVVTFLSLRWMLSDHLYPGLETGGLGFFTDLTKPDDYFRFPILSALATAIQMRFGADVQIDPKQVLIVSVIFFPLMLWSSRYFPMGLHIYWTAAALFGVTQALLLKYTGLRRLFGIPEVNPVKTTPTVTSLLSHPPKQASNTEVAPTADQSKTIKTTKFKPKKKKN